MHWQSSLEITPTQVLKAGDKLVMFSKVYAPASMSDTAPLTYSAASAQLQARAPSKPPGSYSTSQKIIVVAMGPQVIPDFSDDFSDFAPKGSSVTYVLPSSFSTEANAAFKAVPTGGKCKFSVQYVNDGNPASIQVRRLPGGEPLSGEEPSRWGANHPLSCKR